MLGIRNLGDHSSRRLDETLSSGRMLARGVRSPSSRLSEEDLAVGRGLWVAEAEA